MSQEDEPDDYGWDSIEKYDYALDRLEDLLKYGHLRKDEEIQAYTASALFAIANELSAKNKHTKDDYQVTKKIKIRKRNSIPHAIRHEVFKKNNYRCVECGNTNKEMALEPDHIIPVSQGGTDELDNLQTLCFICNRAKACRLFEAEMKKQDDVKMIEEVVDSDDE